MKSVDKYISRLYLRKSPKESLILVQKGWLTPLQASMLKWKANQLSLWIYDMICRLMVHCHLWGIFQKVIFPNQGGDLKMQSRKKMSLRVRWDIWKWEGRKLVYERKWIWDWDETHFKWKSQPRIVSLKDDFEWKSYMAQIMRNFFSLGLKDACSKVIIPCMLLLYL